MTIHISNPNLPASGPGGNFVLFDAFNLVEGAAFMVLDEPDPRVWIVEKSVDDANFERVYLWAHDGSFSYNEMPELVDKKAFNFDYSDKVALVGIVRNPYDKDDNNWGQSFAVTVNDLPKEESAQMWTEHPGNVSRCDKCRGTDFTTNFQAGRHTCPNLSHNIGIKS